MNSYDRTINTALDFLCGQYPCAESLSLSHSFTTTWDDLLSLKKNLYDQFSRFVLLAFTSLYFDEIKAKVKSLAEGPIEAMASIDLKSRAYSYRGNRLLSLVENPDMTFVQFLSASRRTLAYKLSEALELDIKELKRFSHLDSLYRFDVNHKEDMDEDRYNELLKAVSAIYEVFEDKKTNMVDANKLLVQSTSERIYADYPQLKGVVAYEYEP